jgi:hypothetical protein|tara:strand:+ start:2916 stop:4205 length:1290 start_codon:yes stop_codon:yes gene_type:complete
MEIEKIYLINSGDPSADRQQYLISKLEACNFVQNTSFELINVQNFSEGLPAGYKMGPTTMMQQDINISIAHRMVWEKVVFEGKKNILILNDNFLCNNSVTKIEAPDVKWNIAILNRSDFTNNELVSINDNWVRPQSMGSISAYIINESSTAQLLLSGGLNKNLIPFDMYLSAVCYPYIEDQSVNELFRPGLEAIATKDPNYINTEDMAKCCGEPPPSPLIEGDEGYYEILDDSDWEAWKEKYVNLSVSKGEWDLMVDDKGDNIYEFNLFTPKFCKDAIALAESKNKWTQDRHEFYPTNDVLLPELGLNDIYNKVLDEIVRPLSIHLWKLEGKSWNAFSNENFMAIYTTDRQSHLSLHHDRSHLTLVIKLNDEFSGGGTWFPKYQKLINPEVVGTAALHPGMVTHQHGARPITAGKRYIIVSFIRTHDNP